MTMNRSFPGVRVGISFLVMLVSGCGQDPFGPPSRPKPPLTSQEPDKAKAIFYIVPEVPDGELLAWGGSAQTEANLHQVIFRIMGPAPGESMAAQPEMIRRALDDGVSALLVVPGNSPDLPKALAEAESKNVPVVLIGRSIPAPPGSKPFTLVDHAPFEESAKRIVGTIVEDMKKTTRPVEGTALVLVDQTADRTLASRAEALKTAASAAGFPHVSAVPIDGSNLETAKAAVLGAIKSNPDVALVLATSTETMLVGSQARAELKGAPAFFVGGYVGYASSPIAAPFVRESCYVEGRFEELARLGVLTLLKKLDGEQVGELVVQSPRFIRGTGSITTPEVTNSSFPGRQQSISLDDLTKDIKAPSATTKPQ
jgi:ABC-type sugar transport system substrate-binding protein